MNTGQRTIDWLYREQLHVDDAWSAKTPQGFTWWADRHAQWVEVIGSEAGPDGNDGYFVRVKTDFIRNVTLTDQALAGINLLMSTATMAGMVYDNNTKTLSLSSLVRVHEGIRKWMSPLISVAAMLQIADAQLLASVFSPVVSGTSAESGHPASGPRPHPDELAVEFTPLLAAAGARPSSWSPTEFQQAVEEYMQRPPALLATSGGKGLTVEFPYGGRSSLCQMKGDEPHPRIGNGLLLMQSFPVKPMSVAAGTRLALELNAEELDRKPTGYGFGSYCYRDGCIRFTAFIPNAAHRPGLLPNLYYACAGRARAMSNRFTRDDWSGASGPSQPAIASLASAPVPKRDDRVIPCTACGGRGQADRQPTKKGWLSSLFGVQPVLEKCSRCGGTGVARPNRRIPPSQDVVEQAIELMRRQRFGEALPLLRRAIEQDPTRWNTWYMAGQCCRFVNDIDGAIDHLTRAAELTADQAPVFLALGIAFQLKNQWDDAIEAFRRAIELDPDYELAYNSLALTQTNRGELEKALHNYDAGVKALARRIVKAMRNSPGNPVLKHRDTRGTLWTAHAVHAALHIVSSIKGIHMLAFPTGEQAIEEERTERHRGLYWVDAPNEKKETVRLFLPNYFNTFRESLKNDSSYAVLTGGLASVLELLGRSKEANEHRNEAAEFTPRDNAEAIVAG